METAGVRTSVGLGDEGNTLKILTSETNVHNMEELLLLTVEEKSQTI